VTPSVPTSVLARHPCSVGRRREEVAVTANYFCACFVDADGTDTSMEDRRAPRAPSDLVLAERCVRGDPAAQAELYGRECPRVRATLRRLVGASAIDDLVQETFFGVFRTLRHYRGDAALSTWIDRCAVRVAYAWYSRRKRERDSAEELPETESNESSAEQRLLDREALAHLHAALEGLDTHQRVAFLLHVVEERPLVEVAELVEASLEATKTRVFRARRALEQVARLDPILARFNRPALAPQSSGVRPCVRFEEERRRDRSGT